MNRSFWPPLLLAGLALALGPSAHAAPPGLPAACTQPLDAAGAVGCALSRSPEVQGARHELAALAGRRRSAGVLLPSHPELSGTLGRRTSSTAIGEASTTNWSVGLAQEIELPGKRAARLAEVDAERGGAGQRLASVERDVAAATLVALYVAALADEAVTLAAELERSAAGLAAAMAARAGEGLLPPVDADLAAAESVRIATARAEAESRRAAGRAHLGALLGLADARLPGFAPGVLRAAQLRLPATEVLIEQAMAARADLAAATAEEKAARARITRLRRQRLPNLTLSLFAERDAFDEQVWGGGVSIPLVLPTPLGPSGRGEIDEAEARRSQADQQIELLRRRVRSEVTEGIAVWQGRSAAVARYTPPLIERARAHVAALGDAVKNRQLAPREALLAQRSFIELLQGHLEARLGEAVARVQLLRVAALPMPGVSP
jgi:outer membrane protein, heavy metal efflux system